MIENVLVLGDESVVIIFFVLDVKQVVMTYIFVLTFGVAKCSFHGRQSNIVSVEQLFQLCSPDFLLIVRVSVVETILVIERV